MGLILDESAGDENEFKGLANENRVKRSMRIQTLCIIGKVGSKGNKNLVGDTIQIKKRAISSFDVLDPFYLRSDDLRFPNEFIDLRVPIFQEYWIHHPTGREAPIV